MTDMHLIEFLHFVGLTNLTDDQVRIASAQSIGSRIRQELRLTAIAWGCVALGLVVAGGGAAFLLARRLIIPFPSPPPLSEPAPLRPSVLALSFGANEKRVRDQLIASIPHKIDQHFHKQHSEHSYTGGDIHASLIDQDVRASLGGTVVNWTVPYSFFVDGRHETGILGEGKFFENYRIPQDGSNAKLTLSGHTRFAFDKDWRLSATTSLDPIGLEGNFRYEKNILIFNVFNQDFGPQIRDRAVEVLGPIVKNMDANLTAGTDGLIPKITDAWTHIQQPLKLAEQTWLMLWPDPGSLYVGDLKPPHTVAGALAALTARPEILFGDPPTPTIRPLGSPSGEAPEGEGFAVQVGVTLPFSVATEALRKKVVGARFVSPDGNHSLTATALRVSGSNGWIIVEAEVQGDFDATFYLQGRLHYDASRQSVVVTDFDYSIETKSILLKLHDWFAHSEYRDVVMQWLSWPVGDRLDDLRKTLGSLLNRDLGSGLELEGTLSEGPDVRWTAATDEGIRAVMSAGGKVSLVQK